MMLVSVSADKYEEQSDWKRAPEKSYRNWKTVVRKFKEIVIDFSQKSRSFREPSSWNSRSVIPFSLGCMKRREQEIFLRTFWSEKWMVDRIKMVKIVSSVFPVLFRKRNNYEKIRHNAKITSLRKRSTRCCLEVKMSTGIIPLSKILTYRLKV